MSSRSVAGQVVAITGAGRGIGAAIARDLWRAGAKVALGDVDADAVTRLARDFGETGIGVSLDVTDTTSFRGFLDAAQDAFGPIDVLINNAGVMWVGPFADESDDVARRQLEVNVLGVMRGFRLAAPAMRLRRRGHLITIASAASKLSPRGEAAYAATKHAVYGYSCAAHAELHGSGVAVSIIMPTVVETELAAGTSHGLIRRLTPEDVASAVHKAILTRRRDVYVPAPIGMLARVVAILPSAASAFLERLVVPNQLRKADRSRRRAYEERL